MMNHLTKKLMFISVVTGVQFLFAITGSTEVQAWTSAQVFTVDVQLDVAKEGLSTVTTEARFIVEGGRFHGFDLADLPGAEIVRESCVAVRDDGELFPVEIQVLRDGRKRVLLADEKSVKHGGITFRLVHRIDLVATGSLRPYEGRARLDWTPLIWDSGVDRMKLRVSLPGVSKDGPIRSDGSVSRDYVVGVEAQEVTLVKYRPVRWYPMQVVLYFDVRLVPGLLFDDNVANTHSSIVVPAVTADTPPVSFHLALLPAVVALIGLLALILKARHVRFAFHQVEKEACFVLLTRTSFHVRCILGTLTVALGVAVQHMGYLAAGVPAITLAVGFFVMRRDSDVVKPRPGGVWRRMEDEDLKRYSRLVSSYQRSRRSLLDITTAGGFLSFAAYVAGLGYIAFFMRQESPQIAWTVIVDGLILGVPAWFGSIRAELPVDSTLEGFFTLKRWRRALSKLLGAKTPGCTAEFWVREDREGPIDVRLRAELPIEGLNNIEVAGEVFRAGTFFRSRTVFVLRLVPGAEVTRRLARCPHAAEHHLTPDLQEEIIVLRNRRGRVSSGLSPIRGALAMLNR